MSQPPIALQIEGLSVAYCQGERRFEALREVSLTIHAGQTYGLVGESGSGKTTLALAIMGYLPENGLVTAGQIIIEGQDVLHLDEAGLRKLWGAQVSLVPQDPGAALNPSMRIGEQLAETVRYHFGINSQEAERRAVQLLHMVRLPDPERVARSFPHQVSGGMQQRALIAMALSTYPKLLILDEPTTNLDGTTQASILELFRDLIVGSQTAALYVTHNLGVVAQLCDRVAVLYAGELVEDAGLDELFAAPIHPYTRGLLECIPAFGSHKTIAPLQAIPGSIPALGERSPGCVFASRCPLAIEICQERPALYQVNDGHRARCHRWAEISLGMLPSMASPSPQQPLLQSRLASNVEEAPTAARVGDLLQVKEVSVNFGLSRTFSELLNGVPPRSLRAVSAVSLSLPKALTLGLVGESGSGKTTLARAVVGLVEPSAGEIELLQIPLPAHLAGRDIATLRRMQMVFQNPDEALNPHQTVGAALRRPLIRLLDMPAAQADREVEHLLDLVRLPAHYAGRLPGQLSGGEKQRVAIARAFAANPDLLITDEAVSALDVSVQASILNLLSELQQASGVTLLFIAHDLAIVGYIADLIAVIYLGQIMEIARAGGLFEPPYHPYTEALLSAIPYPDPKIKQAIIRLAGDPPSPVDRPAGCPFHPRCPRSLGETCAVKAPPWQQAENGKQIYCHIPLVELQSSQQPVIDLPGRDRRERSAG